MSGAPKVPGYILTDRLGSGTYAVVYKAYSKFGQREVVAVKCVQKESLSSQAVENLLTEIALLKKLKNQFIVEMKDFQWDDSYIYIIMDYCSGGDLSHFICSRRKLPEATCRRFLQQLAAALQFLRKNNVSHMDLKPQNILLTSLRHPNMKLADFGFAQYLSIEEQKTSLRGSPLYMAPEMILKTHYDAKVDLWSVGVILYECLFGKAPFSSKTMAELAEKIKSDKQIELPPGVTVSKECRDLLLRLLQRDPNRRIEYEEFFTHPFLDLEHMPSDESYNKAVELIHNATECDSQKNYPDAIRLYSESLQYFVPLVHYETDVRKKAALRKRVDTYICRAEELKQMMSQSEGNIEIQTSSSVLDELKPLCAMTPHLQTGLEIAQAAVQYQAEGQLQLALDKYERALGMLIPLLSSEPKGRRRELLYGEIQQWMSQAESVKTLLSCSTVDPSKEEAEYLNIGNSSLSDVQCNIQ